MFASSAACSVRCGRTAPLKRIGLCFVCVFAWLGSMRAERLPIRTYTVAEGLPRDSINRIVRDSRGFLWFCTAEGLSRFDGTRFTNFSMADGLPNRSVTDLLETRAGVYWIATHDGLARLNPTGNARVQGHDSRQTFTVYHPREDGAARAITALLEDRAGTIWVGTVAGVYRMVQRGADVSFEFVDLGLPPVPQNPEIEALLEDRHGAMWIAANYGGLIRLCPDGRVEHYTSRRVSPSLKAGGVHALLEDPDGGLWIGAGSGLYHATFSADGNETPTMEVFTTRDGLPSDLIESLFRTTDGRLWIGTASGLGELRMSSKTPRRPLVSTVRGFRDAAIQSVSADQEDNIWIGSPVGAFRLARRGLTMFGEADGLTRNGVQTIFESQEGRLCVISADKGRIYEMVGSRFRCIRPGFPKSVHYFGWGWNQLTLQDRTGEWWIPTGQGLWRFARTRRVEDLRGARPTGVYTTKDGLVSDDVFRLFEDSRGDVWISNVGLVSAGVVRWDRHDARLHPYSESEGLPRNLWVEAFGEDLSGHVWLGMSAGGIARYAAGRFAVFGAAAGVPRGSIRAFHTDRRGRLWIASAEGGVGRIDDPTEDSPHVATVTTADGLASNDIWSFTEDQWGRIYVGTGKGLDRIDPATGRIRHYTTADGLPEVEIGCAHRDRRGVLWFGADRGLHRLVPELEPPLAPPRVVIDGLRIAGIAQRVSTLGETAIANLSLSPSQDNVEIAFAGLASSMGDPLRYEYLLEGADVGWRPPTAERSVSYANLAPGTYRFLVRAVTADGATSTVPASVAFTILPPVWRRWWFDLLIVQLIAGAMYMAGQYRLARMLELERIRARIAADLHDDVGSALSRLSILTEVIKRQIGATGGEPIALLDDMAETSRSMLDGMSDIVWSIDPRRDDLGSLVARVRRFAAGLLDSQGIHWTLEAPAHADRVKLDPQQRRHLFLMCKEAMTNIVRHAACSTVTIALSIVDQHIVIDIRDDGRGMDAGTRSADAAEPGHGLANFRTRAAELGGACRIDSAPEHGTHVHVAFPLRKGTA